MTLVCPVEKVPHRVFALACGRVASVRMLCNASVLDERVASVRTLCYASILNLGGEMSPASPELSTVAIVFFVVMQYSLVDRIYIPILPHCDEGWPWVLLHVSS